MLYKKISTHVFGSLLVVENGKLVKEYNKWVLLGTKL